MANYQKILVVVDPTSDEQSALARAVELASRSKAKLTVFLSIFDLSYEMTSILSSQEREAMRQGVIEQRKEWLNDLISPFDSVGIDISTQVTWYNRPFESILNFAITQDFDLIIKGTHAHGKIKSAIFTPTDWHLLRKAPMPVLMVKEHDWPVSGKIICAINVSSEDQEHIQLNDKIIKYGKDLANKFKAELHLVNGYPGTPVNLAIELPDFDANIYNNAIYVQHEKRVKNLATRYEIEERHCHIKEGLAEDVIPELAMTLDAELVILGTIGRTGLSAAIIGNTAEHVIDALHCDLLAIKPDGYSTPFKITTPLE